MEKEEKLNLLSNKKMKQQLNPNWYWVNDGKRFGWNKSRKNRYSQKGYKTHGTSWKVRQKLIKQIKHKILFCIPLNEEELKFYENSSKWLFTQN